MKRSHLVMLMVGGTSLAGLYAYGQHACRPDPTGATPYLCSRTGASYWWRGYYGGYGSSYSRSSDSSSSSGSSAVSFFNGSTSRGGFGMSGAAHASGGSS